MELSNAEIAKLSNRILNSRTRCLLSHPFYGLLLMHMKFGLDDEIGTAATNAEYILFNPDFLKSLSDNELDFILMHEVLHVALDHCFRGQNYLDQELFNIACDIVVNSTICKEEHMDISSICVGSEGSSMHKAPNGDDGYKHSAEDVYALLCLELKKYGKLDWKKLGCGLNKPEELENPSKGNGQGKDGKGKGNSKGKGKTGFSDRDQSNKGDGDKQDSSLPPTIDDHSKWSESMDANKEKAIDEWHQRIKEAAEAVSKMNQGQGNVPGCVQREIDKFTHPKVDWRTELNNFIQEEINDYSFNPPDVRLQDCPFILPSFSEKDEVIKDVLFFIDTSGSMSKEIISAAFSEIKGAMEQYNEKLQGFVAFFDAKVYGHHEIESVDDILKLKPSGGGGTSFNVIFKYIDDNFKDREISSIIILTDGYCNFPHKSVAHDVPVLWGILNNEKTDAPWGKTIHIDI